MIIPCYPVCQVNNFPFPMSENINNVALPPEQSSCSCPALLLLLLLLPLLLLANTRDNANYVVKDATKVAAQARIVKPVGFGLPFMGQVQLIIEQVRPSTAHPSSRISDKCLCCFDPLMDFQCFAKTFFIHTLEWYMKTRIYLCAHHRSTTRVPYGCI